MNLSLFSEFSVQEFYDSTVTQIAERRVFNINDEDLRANSTQSHIDGILTILSPGRLVLDPTVNEESHTDVNQQRRIRRWIEFCGSVRLLTLRPRQYYATPPHVGALQPPASGQVGRIIIEHSIGSLAEENQFNEFCDSEFRKIKDYSAWVNEDLEYYELTARGWIQTLIDAKKKRLPYIHSSVVADGVLQ